MKKTSPNTSRAIQRYEPAPGTLYPIDTVVQLTQTPRHLIVVYCRHGLISPAAPPESDGWWFDEEAIYELCRIRLLRAEYGLETAALRLVLKLCHELELLREEVRFQRSHRG